MKFKIYFFSLYLFSSLSGFSQQQKLRAYVDTKQFYSPEVGNYLEIYLQFVASSVKYAATPDGIQAKIACEFEVLQKDKTIQKDVYALTSPVAIDSVQEDFYEVKRFVLDSGNYTLKLVLEDVNKKGSIVHAQFDFRIEDWSKNIHVSDIEVAEYAIRSDEMNNFQKSGFHIIPLISNFYPSSISKMPVYFEVYNTQMLPDSVVGVLTKIVDTQTGTEMEDFKTFTKIKTAAVVPFLKTIDIAQLPTGNYALTVCVVDPKLNIVNQNEYVFERSNDLEWNYNPEKMVLDPAFQKSISDDSVGFYLACLIPIAKPAEVKNILATLRTKNPEKCRRHIQAFWLQSAPKNSYEAWIKYKAVVLQVENMFGNNFQEGFETDRGRVYLKYGPPNTLISRETSASEYPYEIWTYDKIGTFSNRRFVFYNPDLVNKGYRLLHSDMLGEVKNPGWQQVLNSRNSNRGDVDDPNRFMQRNMGDNSFDYFRQY
jgi:GWxTD domain-containing protein